MKIVELITSLGFEPATTPDRRLFADMTITSVSEDRQTHQRIYRMNLDQLRLTAHLLQLEIDHLEALTTQGGPRH